MKTQPVTYPNLNDIMIELVKKLQGMKNQKDNLEREIDNGEMLKAKLSAQIQSFTKELEKINESLEQKETVLDVYDRILNESDNAYSKIVKSTEALYQMVKNEEKKVVPAKTFSTGLGMK